MPSSGNDVLIQFTNCRLVRDHQLIRDDLWIRNGRIINPEPVFFDEKKQAHKKYDCNNAIIAAGYIDLQINGTLMKFVLCGAVYACACVCDFDNAGRVAFCIQCTVTPPASYGSHNKYHAFR